MLELSEKDFKATIIKMLQWEIINKLKTSERTENFNKETKNTNWNKIVFPVLASAAHILKLERYRED